MRLSPLPGPPLMAPPVCANNGGLILNTVTFSSDANLAGTNSDATLTNVHFHRSATLDGRNGGMTANGTTFAGAASLTIEASGHITTTNTTFHSTALLSAPN